MAIGLGFVSLLATILMKWLNGTFMTGNPLLLLSAMLALIGVQFISTGAAWRDDDPDLFRKPGQAIVQRADCAELGNAGAAKGSMT